jgi:hypothetical protein
MKRKPKLDVDKVAKMLGAERGVKVTAKGGYFGALQLAAEVGESLVPNWSAKAGP